MPKEQLVAALKEAIVRDLRLADFSPEDIESTEPLFGDSGLGLDSLDAVELVVIVEKHFGVSITNAEEARHAFASVDVLADYILTRRQQA